MGAARYCRTISSLTTTCCRRISLAILCVHLAVGCSDSMTDAVWPAQSQAQLLPAYRYLSRFLRRALCSIHDESRATSAEGSTIPDVPAVLVDIVADYLWLPQHSCTGV
jgi:hypothetical protein